jgi:hypothetical protein
MGIVGPNDMRPETDASDGKSRLRRNSICRNEKRPCCPDPPMVWRAAIDTVDTYVLRTSRDPIDVSVGRASDVRAGKPPDMLNVYSCTAPTTVCSCANPSETAVPHSAPLLLMMREPLMLVRLAKLIVVTAVLLMS